MTQIRWFRVSSERNGEMWEGCGGGYVCKFVVVVIVVVLGVVIIVLVGRVGSIIIPLPESFRSETRSFLVLGWACF